MELHAPETPIPKEVNSEAFTLKPIGLIETCFKEKNGTPRQGVLCQHSRARLKIDFGNPNPEHSLVHNKIAPPRLEDAKVGVFATRSPHRPNPIGLSVAKLIKIVSNCLYLSGIDLIDGTPVLDVKPYLPGYDSVPTAVIPNWIAHPPRPPLTRVSWKPEALEQMKKLMSKMEFYDNETDLKCAIEEVLTLDPRSTHFKRNAYMEAYGFCIDILNVLSTFDPDGGATVIELQDWSQGKPSNLSYTKKQKTTDEKTDMSKT